MVGWEGVRGSDVFYGAALLLLLPAPSLQHLTGTASCHVAFPGTMRDGTFLRLRTTEPFTRARTFSAPAFALPAPMHSPFFARINTSSPVRTRVVNEIKARSGGRSSPGRG